MKIQYVYEVVREVEVPDGDLQEEIDFFRGAMKDETDEYLYGGCYVNEKVNVEMWLQKNGQWETIDGLTRYDMV